MSDDRSIFEKGADKAREMGQDMKEGAQKAVDKTKETAHNVKCKMTGEKEKCSEKCSEKAHDTEEYIGDRLRGAARTVEGH